MLPPIIFHRKSVSPLDEKCFDLTVRYCKVEARLSIYGFVIFWVVIAICEAFAPLLNLNDLRLSLNFYIPGLRFEVFDWKWCLNFIFQVVNVLSFSVFFIVFVPLTLLLLNQVCLKVDESALLVEKLNKSLVDFSIDKPKSDEPKATSSDAIKKVVGVAVDKEVIRNAEIKELTQRIAEMINSVNEWRREIQDLMQLCFLIEFVILSLCFSLSPFTITENSTGSISVLMGLSIFLAQLFLYCWSGTRFGIRVEKFAASIYDIEWQEMIMKERKDLQLMLMMTQNIGGFDGVFKRVNFETFKEVSCTSVDIRPIIIIDLFCRF